jgi:hypothetical protein
LFEDNFEAVYFLILKITRLRKDKQQFPSSHAKEAVNFALEQKN